MEQQKAPQLFVWYITVDGVRVPRFLVPAQSKHEALEGLKAQGHTMGFLEVAEQCDPADLVRLIVPSLSIQLAGIARLLGIIAQDAQERLTERAKSRLGVVRGN